MPTVRSEKRKYQSFAQCLWNSRQVWILLLSPISTEEQPPTDLVEQWTQSPKIQILFRSCWIIPVYNSTCAHEDQAGCSSFLLFRGDVHRKMNTQTYENLCLSNKQDFILFTEVAQFLINCEHQLPLSPWHNFKIIKKNGRGREKSAVREGESVLVLSADKHQNRGMVKGNI